MLTDWLQDHFVKKIGVSFRAVTKPGDIITCKGKIANKFVDGDEHCVELDIVAENQRGENAASGKAVAVLPCRSPK
jgi:acyl dehydratase